VHLHQLDERIFSLLTPSFDDLLRLEEIGMQPLRARLSELPSAERGLLLLTVVEGLTVSQACTVMHLSKPVALRSLASARQYMNAPSVYPRQEEYLHGA